MLRKVKLPGMACFSPPVMLATFIIEIALAVYTVIRYKFNEVGKLAVALLVSLAAFQIAEFNVCETGWVDPMLASRLGYVAITLLPPLGIHLAYALAGTKKRPLMWPAYISGAAFAALFLVVTHALSGHVCQGNYVIFQMVPWSVWLYSVYYYGWLIAGIVLAAKLAKGHGAPTRRALYGLAAGYVAFVGPTTAANLLAPETLQAIPSVMCGFAVLLALTLACWVLPYAGIKRFE